MFAGGGSGDRKLYCVSFNLISAECVGCVMVITPPALKRGRFLISALNVLTRMEGLSSNDSSLGAEAGF